MNKAQDWKLILIDTLSRIDNPASMQAFLEDIMTTKETQEISARLQAAWMLKNKESYIVVSNKTGLSSRTVARVSDWLKQNNGGYTEAISLIEKHQPHI